MQTDVPAPFLDHVKKTRNKKKQPKLDFNSKDCLALRQAGIVVLCNRSFEFEEKNIKRSIVL